MDAIGPWSAPAAPAGAPPTSTGNPAPGADAPAFLWEREVNGLFNRETLSVLAPGAALVVAFLIVVCLAVAVAVPGSGPTMLLALAIVIVLVPVIIWAASWFGDLLNGRPLPVEFEVGPAGARFTRSLGRPVLPKAVGTAVEVLEAFDLDHGSTTESPPGPRTTTWAWRDVTSVTYDMKRHVITLGPTYWHRLVLYCGPEEWDTVVAWVRWGTPKGARVLERGGSGLGSVARQ